MVPEPLPLASTHDVDDGKVVALFGLGARQACADKQQRLIGEDRQEPAVACGALDREARRRRGAGANLHRAGGLGPLRAPFRSAAAPPVLNAATNASASLCGILRSIVMVTGALADAPPAPLPPPLR